LPVVWAGGGGTFKGKASRLPIITSVDADSFSIGKKTYLVDELARIQVNGKRASLAEIQPGMRVLVGGRVLQRGKTNADTIYRATRVTARTVVTAKGKKNSKSKGTR